MLRGQTAGATTPPQTRLWGAPRGGREAGRGQTTAQRPRSKRRRGDDPTAPFCCLPPPGARGRGFCLVAGFTREGARHNGFLCEPAGRAAFGPAHALCIRRRYVEHRHSCQRSAQDLEPSRGRRTVRHHRASRRRTASAWRVLSRGALWRSGGGNGACPTWQGRQADGGLMPSALGPVATE